MVEHELRYSLYNHKVISIIYFKRGKVVQRRIQVLKIEDKIVKALDIDKQDIRSFSKENILAAMNEGIIKDEKEWGKTNKYLSY